MADKVDLVACCYEKFLFGFSVEEGESSSLRKMMAVQAHMGAVKCVASGGGYIASGGADDLIRLFDTKNGVADLGFLAHHSGTVSCLAFHPSAASLAADNLLSGGDDGDIVIWQAGGRWDKLKTLRAHKGGVTGLAVHPSGALALSVGRDRGLRLWDLVKGRCTYKTKMAAEGHHLGFFPGGSQYYILAEKSVGLWDAEGGSLYATIPQPSKVLCAAHAPGGGALLTAGEGGFLSAWDQSSGKEVLSVPKAHAVRIRGVAVPWAAGEDGSGGAGPSELPRLVATASTDGEVKLWDLRNTSAALSTLATNARMTSLVAVPPAPRLFLQSKPVFGAQDDAPKAGKKHGAHKDAKEKGEIWWEEGNEGAKLGPLLAKRKKEREEADKHLRGVPLKELKAMKKAEKEKAQEVVAFGKEPAGDRGGGGKGGKRGGDGGGGDGGERRQSKGGGGGQGAKSSEGGAKMKPLTKGGFGGGKKGGGALGVASGRVEKKGGGAKKGGGGGGGAKGGGKGGGGGKGKKGGR